MPWVTSSPRARSVAVVTVVLTLTDREATPAPDEPGLAVTLTGTFFTGPVTAPAVSLSVTLLPLVELGLSLPVTPAGSPLTLNLIAPLENALRLSLSVTLFDEPPASSETDPGD